MKPDDMPDAFPEADLERRYNASRRLGWLLGAVVLLIYLVGLFIKR